MGFDFVMVNGTDASVMVTMGLLDIGTAKLEIVHIIPSMTNSNWLKGAVCHERFRGQKV